MSEELSWFWSSEGRSRPVGLEVQRSEGGPRGQGEVPDAQGEVQSVVGLHCFFFLVHPEVTHAVSSLG